MAWRLAKSLVVLRNEVNRIAPNRSKASDGTIGDAAHASRNSDHNPYIKDDQGVGVVRAFDVTHDPDGGMDAHQLANDIRLLGQAGDRRIRYIISNRRIASRTRSFEWRTYTGSNPHTQHAHISVVEDRAGYDSTDPWFPPEPSPDTEPEDTMIRPADLFKFIQPAGAGVFLANLEAMTAEGISTHEARLGIAEVWALNPDPAPVHPDVLAQFRITEGGR